MSYCRAAEGYSDLTLYLDIDGNAVCCYCRLAAGNRSVNLYDLYTIRRHIVKHEKAGHRIPSGVLTAIEKDFLAGE